MDYLAELREIIESKGTVKEAAKKIKVSNAFLGDVLLGKNYLSIPLAYKLEKAFPGVDGHELLQTQLRHKWEAYKKKAKSKK